MTRDPVLGLALTGVEGGLQLVERLTENRAARLGTGDCGDEDQIDEVPDLLLATIFDEHRSWEIACERVEVMLTEARVDTLVRFLG